MFLKPVVIANWKMHKTAKETKDFVQELAKKGEILSPIGLAVPFTCIAACSETVDSQVIAGAQNFYPMPQGAYTGEISAQMIKEAGARFVLVGHSERRHLFGETNAFVNEKVHCAIKEGLIPVVCVGETLEERRSELAKESIKKQIIQSLEGINASQFSSILLAYEPVWAIGKGVAASFSEVEAMFLTIQEVILNFFGAQALRDLSVLYGGSVNEQNAQDLLNIPNVDGLLVGGASLEVQKFATLLKNINVFTEKGL